MITTSNDLLAIFLVILIVWVIVATPYLIFYTFPISRMIPAVVAGDKEELKKFIIFLSRHQKLQKIFHTTTAIVTVALILLFIYRIVIRLQ